MSIFLKRSLPLLACLLIVGCPDKKKDDHPKPDSDFFGDGPKLQPIDEQKGRMKLLADFTYTDRNKVKWTALKDYVTDGASIPQVFWTVVGSPFTGNYLKAAVIHDYYCDKRSKPWQDVHETFYHGCLSGGVDPVKAKIMYGAVYYFGPRWPAGSEKDAKFEPQIVKALRKSKGFTDFEKKHGEVTGPINFTFLKSNKGIVLKSKKTSREDLKSLDEKLQKEQMQMFKELVRHIEKENPPLKRIRQYEFKTK